MTDNKHFLRTPLNEAKISKFDKGKIKTSDHLNLSHAMAKHKTDQEHDDAFHESNKTRHPHGATEKHHDIEYTRLGHKESSFHAVLQHHGYKQVASHSAGSSRWSHPDLGGAISVHDSEPNHRVKTTVSSHGRTPGELHRRLTDIGNAPAMPSPHHVHEEVELAEVSSEYLDKYIHAAKKQGASGYGHRATDEKDGARAFKRMKGIHKAEESKDEKTPVTGVKVHNLTHIKDDQEVYDHTQTHDKIKDGDVLKLHGKRTAYMHKAWPTMLHGKSEHLHSLKDPSHKIPKYKETYEKAATAHKDIKEEVEIEEGKTLRATGDYKRDNLTKSIKRYSADKRKVIDSKRKIEEGARIDELFGFLRSKDSKPLPVHQRVEPTFGAKPKPKAAAPAKKVSSKPLPVSQRKEPNLHGITPASKTPEHKPAPVAAKVAPAKPKSTRNTLANRLANVKAWKKPEKKVAAKSPAAPAPAKTEPAKHSSPLKPVAIGSVVKSKKTVKEEMAPATIIKDKKYRAALKKAMAAGLIQPDRSHLDTTGGNTDEYTP